MDVIIKITTGNDTVKTVGDIANLLIELAKRIKRDGGFDKITKVMDVNGNSVGTVETSEWDDQCEDDEALSLFQRSKANGLC
jgi:hypothetical protein